MRPDELAELHDFLNAEAASILRRRPHRLPEHAYSVPGEVYCVTLCARRQGKPFEIPEIARGVIAAVRFYRDRRHYLIRAFCLMPDHLHLVLELCAPSQGLPMLSIVELMTRFKRYTTTHVAWKYGLHGELWQRDSYDHIGRTATDVENQCNYVLDNPVRGGLVASWQDWPWSGTPDPWDA